MKDPSMLGQTRYARQELDFYPTPARATLAYAKVPYITDLLKGVHVWEPAAGNGAIVKVLTPFCAGVIGTDIKAYDGYDAEGLYDFMRFFTEEEAFFREEHGEDADTLFTLDDLSATPGGIVTNPPYGDEAEAFARKAISLMTPVGGFVSLLCRHEWDCAKGRADLFDHPSFSAKITLRFRPMWVEKKPGEEAKSPRFSFAWYCWDTSKDPSVLPVCLYAG